MPKATAVVVAALGAFAAACGGGESTDGVPVAGDVPVEIVAAVDLYVRVVGLSGDTSFILLPAEQCEQVSGQAGPSRYVGAARMGIIAAHGAICILADRSQVGATSAQLTLGIPGTEARWELTLEKQDASWLVTAQEFRQS